MINLSVILPRIVLTAIVLGLIGAWPTWRLAGREGLIAQLVAAVIVVTVMFANAVITKYFSSKGSAKIALAFVLSGMARVILCLGLTVGTWAVFSLPPKLLLVWVVIFYLATLMTESICLSRALSKKQESDDKRKVTVQPSAKKGTG